jgi:hypothetical protein
VPVNAGIEPRTVATMALAVRHSYPKLLVNRRIETMIDGKVSNSTSLFSESSSILDLDDVFQIVQKLVLDLAEVFQIVQKLVD